MQRYNLFYQVHKGLRALLYETALQIQHTDFWNADDGEDAIEKINDVIRLFENHAHSEDTQVFPAVEKYEPSVADAFDRDHIKDHFLGQLLTLSMVLYENSEIITKKAGAAKQVHAAFSKFMLFNIEQMAKEEDLLNPILWRYYTDTELTAISQQIIAGIPPDLTAQYSKWMMRGLNNAEIVVWLRGVERNAPEVVFQSLFVAAEKELPETRFRKVIEALAEGEMLA